MSVERFKIVQTGSPIRRPWRQRQTLIGLGLNKTGCVSEVPNTRATWGMIAKVAHLVRVVDQELYEDHRLRDLEQVDEKVDKRLVRNLIFEPRRIRAKDVPEGRQKTPDFELFVRDELRAYCEVKSPTDGELFEFPNDLQPGEIRTEVSKDPASFSLSNHIAKAAGQFNAANPERKHPNILVFVNHARRKGSVDLRIALEGILGPGGKRWFPLVNEKDEWEVQQGVWDAARSIDLYVWVDARKKTWQAFQPTGAARVNEACALLGIEVVGDAA